MHRCKNCGWEIVLRVCYGTDGVPRRVWRHTTLMVGCFEASPRKEN